MKVKAQWYEDREGGRSRGLSEGLLPMTFVSREFGTREEAEVFLNSLPACNHMREGKWIEE